MFIVLKTMDLLSRLTLCIIYIREYVIFLNAQNVTYRNIRFFIEKALFCRKNYFRDLIIKKLVQNV